jgi:hypothetical protein
VNRCADGWRKRNDRKARRKRLNLAHERLFTGTACDQNRVAHVKRKQTLIDDPRERFDASAN